MRATAYLKYYDDEGNFDSEQAELDLEAEYEAYDNREK